MDNNLNIPNPAGLNYPAQAAPKLNRAWTDIGLAWLKTKRTVENYWLVAALVLAGISHCWNLFAYPYLENDEGLYSAQAFSVFNEGRLAPYTYWYDHPPLGWMQLGAWLKLTGLMTFGNAVNGGRVFIALVYLASCYFMFKLVAQLAGNWLGQSSLRYVTAFGAVAVLSLSPLSIFFQRQVLLDNIMVAWVLGAYYILLVRYPKEYNLLELYGSAVALGVGILTKEIAVIFIPPMLWLVWRLSNRHHRNFAVVGWAAVMVSLVSAWFLYAFLKGELFPSGSFLSRADRHVSLIDTLEFQAGRGTGLPFWTPGSDFRGNWETNWATLDSFTPVLGAAACLFSLVVGLIFKSKRAILVPVLPAALYAAFLLRGGIVLYYYILPHLPWLAMSIALAGSLLFIPAARLKNPAWKKIGTITVAFGVVALVAALAVWQAESGYGRKILTGDQTYGQKLARDYVLDHVPNDATIVADDFFYLDLRQPADKAKAKSNVQIYFKVDTDPEIGQEMLNNDWRNVDYMLVTLQQMQKDIAQRGLPILAEAYQHSHLVKSFPSREGWELQLLQIDPMEITRHSYPAGLTFKPGETFEMNVDVTAIKGKTIQDFNLLLEVRQNLQKVGQAVVHLDSLTLGDNQVATFRWKIPANLPPGQYEINIGAFDKTWHDNFLWQVFKDPITVTPQG